MFRSKAVRKDRERGFVLIMFATSALVLFGFLGLAVDSAYGMHQKQKMQTAADAGALAAVQELLRGNLSLGDAVRQDTALNGFTDGVAGTTVRVNRPPTSGTYQGRSNYVEVLVSQATPTYFMRVLNVASMPIAARSVAGLGSGGGAAGCIFLLHPTFEAGYYTDGGATMVSDCGMSVNSTSDKSITNQGTTTISGGTIRTRGRMSNSGSISPAPLTRSAAAVVDLLNYPAPSSTGLVNRTTGTVTGVRTLQPGIYDGGINIGSGAVVTFSPGLYYIRNGTLKGTSAQLIGAGVTFFFTGSISGTPVLMDTMCVLNLSAPLSDADGGLESVLFYLDRSVTNVTWGVDIQSNGIVKLEGALYFPTASILWQSQSNVYLGKYTMIVAKYLRLDGSGTKMKIHADYSGLSTGNPVKTTAELGE